MGGTPVGLSVEDPEDARGTYPARAARLSIRFTPVAVVITAVTLLALGLRVYQLARPGHLLGVGDYDDGADFGSAILLTHGVVPYRDFITVQPPGITLLMTPAALLSPLVGTAWAIAAGRILTVLASVAAVVLGGLIVRHRGLFAALATCGLIAIYPGSVQAAHTVLLEPWLVLFCLTGVALAFDGDSLAGDGRLTWSGLAFGFAGAVKLWAIIPTIVILVILLAKRRRPWRYLVGVCAGFGVPVVPFAAMAPGRFYEGVVKAQLIRTFVRTPLIYRLRQLTGLTGWHPAKILLVVVAVIMVAGVAATLVAASLATRRWPPALEWFAVAMTGLVVVAFLVPDNFYYHYSAFLGPFLAMAFALPAARLIDNTDPAWLRQAAAGVAAATIVALPVAAPQAEDSPSPTFSAGIAAVTRVILPGACVVSDQASLLISAGRFLSSVTGCVPVVDGFGTSYALGGHSARAPGAMPAVAEVWQRAFGAAQYVLLTRDNPLRIAWTPELRSYLSDHFVEVYGPWPKLQLYVRSH